MRLNDRRWWIILGLVMIGSVVGLGGNRWSGKDDFRIGVAGKEGVMMVSVSPSRRMINIVKVDKETEIWFPGGMGWYKSDRMAKILDQEKDMSLFEGVLFYNFGFVADWLVVGEPDDWQEFGFLANRLGWAGWARYRLMADEFLMKEETWGGKELELKLDEVAARDLADDGVLEGGKRLRVYNASGIDGLGRFLAKRLEWGGFVVDLVENSEKKVSRCRVVMNRKTQTGGVLERILRWWGCEQSGDEDMADNDVELYLGEELAEVIKYLSYKRDRE